MPANAVIKDVDELHRSVGEGNRFLEKINSHLVPVAASEGLELSPLLDSISEFLRRYIVFPRPEQPVAIALWVAHTWLIDAFEYTPYLHVLSPEKQCGKTLLLE